MRMGIDEKKEGGGLEGQGLFFFQQQAIAFLVGDTTVAFPSFHSANSIASLIAEIPIAAAVYGQSSWSFGILSML